jgi:CHAT domain-containing protein/tetratricopeptide (TPR) repeat protein
MLRRVLVYLFLAIPTTLPAAETATASGNERDLLLTLADSLAVDGRCDSALTLWSGIIGRSTDSGAGSDTATAAILMRMGDCFIRTDQEDSASVCFASALALWGSTVEPRHPPAARCLNELALLALDAEEFRRAESLYTEVVGSYEAGAGTVHTEILRAYNGVAVARMHQANYAGAERVLQRGMAAAAEAPEANSLPKTIIRSNLALNLMWLGRYAEAEEHYREIYRDLKERYGELDEHLLGPLRSLALIARHFKRNDQAEALSLEVAALIRHAWGEDDPRLLRPLNDLATLYLNMNRLEESERACHRLMAIAAEAYGENSQSYLAGLLGLAKVYAVRGDTARLGPIYPRLRDDHLRRAASGSQQEALSLERFAWYFRQYDPQTCLNLGRTAFDIRYNNLRENAHQLSSGESLRFSQFMRRSASVFLSCYLDVLPEAGVDAAEVADLMLLSKGSVADVLYVRGQVLAESGAGRVNDLRDSLEAVKSELAALVYSQGDGSRRSDPGATYDSLHWRKEHLEAELAGADELVPRKDSVTVASVRAALPANSALLEYLRFYRLQSHEDTLLPGYLALIIRSDRAEPQIVDLGPGRETDSLVRLYREHMLRAAQMGGTITDSIQAQYETIAQSLYRRVWLPVRGHLTETELVLVAPDGPLSLLAWVGLVDDEGHFLVEEYHLHHLTAGRDVLRLKRKSPSGSGLLVLGDPDFNCSAAVRPGAPSDGALAVAGAAAEDGPGPQDILRWMPVDCPEIADLKVYPLPGTAREIADVERCWRGASREPVIALTGPAASERNLKRLAAGKRVIHLATHGFYLASLCADSSRPRIGEVQAEFTEDNPLLHTGLLLAGANIHEPPQGPDDEDGILTAEEVTCLDLRGVERVMLSGCETGLGDVQAGEGIFGLRRAFHMAGARTVVSSLWPVSDRVTASFMTSIYDGLDKPLHRAIREYQLGALKRLRSGGYSDHPVKWAAFLSTGDWH